MNQWRGAEKNMIKESKQYMMSNRPPVDSQFKYPPVTLFEGTSGKVGKFGTRSYDRMRVRSTYLI